MPLKKGSSKKVISENIRAHTKGVLKTLARDGVVMDKEVLTKKKALDIAI